MDEDLQVFQIMFSDTELKKQWLYWYPRVYGYFYKRIGQKYEIEELTANTLNTVFLAQNIKDFKAYLWKVAHNYLVRYINTKNLEPMTISLDDSMEFVDQRLENTTSRRYNGKLEQLKKCIQNQIKDEHERQLLDLCIQQEKNSTEVGKLLNLNPGNVRQKLFRTLKKLRESCRQLWPFEN